MNNINDRIAEIKFKIDYMVYSLRKVNPYNFEYGGFAFDKIDNKLRGVGITQDYYIDKELTKRYRFDITYINHKDDIYFIDYYGLKPFIKDTYFSNNVWIWINDRAFFYPDKKLSESVKYGELKFIYNEGLNNQIIVNIDREIIIEKCGVCIPVY